MISLCRPALWARWNVSTTLGKGERPSVRMELQDITAYLRNRAEVPKDRMPKLPVKIRRKEKVL
jgi:hypothetical protein